MTDLNPESKSLNQANKGGKQAVAAGGGGNAEDADLEARLDALRRS
jgi:hypothetical protein